MFALTPQAERFAVGEELLLSPTPGGKGEPIPVTVEASRVHRGRHLLELDRIADRTAAEQRAGWYLLIPYAAAEAARGEDEFFLHALVGREVRSADGRPLGEVSDVLEAEGGPLLEIRGGDGRLRLLPFVRAFVQEVAEAKIMVSPPEGWEEL